MSRVLVRSCSPSPPFPKQQTERQRLELTEMCYCRCVVEQTGFKTAVRELANRLRLTTR